MKLHEWLQIAIGNEIEAADVYDRIAQKSEPEIAGIARIFMGEELSHIERIGAIKNSIREFDGELSADMLALAAPNDKTKQSFDEELSFMSRKELFLFALKGEKESIELYSELEKLFEKGSQEQALFEKLAAEEQKHMFFVLQQLHGL